MAFMATLPQHKEWTNALASWPTSFCIELFNILIATQWSACFWLLPGNFHSRPTCSLAAMMDTSCYMQHLHMLPASMQPYAEVCRTFIYANIYVHILNIMLKFPNDSSMKLQQQMCTFVRKNWWKNAVKG